MLPRLKDLDTPASTPPGSKHVAISKGLVFQGQGITNKASNEIPPKSDPVGSRASRWKNSSTPSHTSKSLCIHLFPTHHRRILKGLQTKGLSWSPKKRSGNKYMDHNGSVCHPYLYVILIAVLALRNQWIQKPPWDPPKMTSWWFQPIWKLLVKLDHYPR